MQNNLRLQESSERSVRGSVLLAERKLFQGREKKLFLALLLCDVKQAGFMTKAGGSADVRFAPTEWENRGTIADSGRLLYKTEKTACKSGKKAGKVA